MTHVILIVTLIAASAFAPAQTSQTAIAAPSPVKKEQHIDKKVKSTTENKPQVVHEEEQETGAAAKEEIVEFVIYPE